MREDSECQERGTQKHLVECSKQKQKERKEERNVNHKRLSWKGWAVGLWQSALEIAFQQARVGGREVDHRVGALC